MKVKVLLVFLMCLAFTANAQTSITGLWNTGQKNTLIEITEVDGRIEGLLLSSDKAEAPIGSLIIKDIQEEDGEISGQLYAIKKDRWVDATFSRQEEELIIVISAGWRKRTVKWQLAD